MVCGARVVLVVAVAAVLACVCGGGGANGLDCSSYVAPSGYAYEFSGLEGATFWHADQGYNYTFGVCSVVACGEGVTDAAACQDDVGTMVVTGRITDVNITEALEGEAVAFLYPDGDLCHDGSPRMTRVSVVCDPYVSTPAVLFIGETSHCVYQFMLKAPEGCPTNGPPAPPAPLPSPPPVPHPPAPPPSGNACLSQTFVASSGYEYSLANLQDTHLSVNVEVDELAMNFVTFVCGTVACDHGTDVYPAVCGTDPSNEATVFGQVTHSSFQESILGPGKGFTLIYSGGDPCSQSSGAAYTAIIDFICAPAGGDLVFETLDGCEVSFSYKTPYACPTNISPPPPAPGTPPASPPPPFPPPAPGHPPPPPSSSSSSSSSSSTTTGPAPFNPGKSQGLPGSSVAAIVIVLLLVLAGGAASAWIVYRSSVSGSSSYNALLN